MEEYPFLTKTAKKNVPMNYFKKNLNRKIKGSSMVEIMVALIISMLLFYISMSILLKLNFNRQFLVLEKSLLYYRSNQLIIEAPEADHDYLMRANCTVDSTESSTFPGLMDKKMTVNTENGKFVFSVFGISKQVMP